MNQTLFHIINNLAGQWPWFDKIAIFSAVYVWIIMTLTVLALAVINFKKWKDLAIVAVISAGVARGVFVTIIKWLYVHPRPELVTTVHAIVKADAENSFPSGHATFVFALAAGVYFYNKKLGVWFYILAALVSIARVFIGVHWPYDIIAGAALGIATAFVCDKLYRRYK